MYLCIKVDAPFFAIPFLLILGRGGVAHVIFFRKRDKSVVPKRTKYAIPNPIKKQKLNSGMLIFPSIHLSIGLSFMMFVGLLDIKIYLIILAAIKISEHRKNEEKWKYIEGMPQVTLNYLATWLLILQGVWGKIQSLLSGYMTFSL